MHALCRAYSIALVTLLGMLGGACDDASSGSDAAAPRAPDAGKDAARTTVERFASERLTDPPSYMGSVDNSAACSMRYETLGYQPADTTTAHPLFLYFAGTVFAKFDLSASRESPAALRVVEAMARRGFVALSVGYDNGVLAWASDHRNQLQCLFDQENPESLLGTACALPQVDCDFGIATWGHSQGAFVGEGAASFDARVRAVWTTGYGGDGGTTFPRERLRVVNGEADGNNGSAATLRAIAGLAESECPDPDQCLRADGSGFIIVRKSALAMPEQSTADHCWFDRQRCADPLMLEPNWIDPASDKSFALETNADWVASTTSRP